jgi:hypothetical protein
MIRAARVGVVLAAFLPAAVACSTPASARSCGALADCQKFAVRHYGHAVLVNAGLLYTVAADSPAGTAPAGKDQQLMTRIVGEIQ